MTSDFTPEVEIRPFRACAMKNTQYNAYLWPFIGLTIGAKIIGGERPLVPEILDQSDRVGAKSPIFDLFSLVAPQP